MKHFLTVPIFSLFLTYLSLAKVWEVPAQCPTIQAGLDSCSAGDTVIVAPGIYYENIIWPSTQSIYLMSESGPDSTIIDGGNMGKVISLVFKDSITTLKGFTIQNGYSLTGAGISIFYSSPKIIDNVIKQNVVYGPPDSSSGGGIFIAINSSPLIQGNLICENSATASVGGGIVCLYNSNPTIINNTIDSNQAVNGAGIFIFSDCEPIIENNLIRGNNTDGVNIFGSTSMLSYNVISHNIGAGIYCEADSNSQIDYNNIYENSGYEVSNASSSNIVNAINNWWGNESGPYHPILNPSGTAGEVSDYVNFIPWLLNPITEVEDYQMENPPSHFKLSQNYPNPFNPGTKISWQVPVCSWQTLKIYDVLGNEVVTLVDEYKPAGSYEVEFNSNSGELRNLTSGVYFYQLKAGEFIQTKKMLLLK